MHKAAVFTKNPGQSVEQIKKALGVATKDLQLPIVRLIAAKKLMTKGRKRGTRYFASGAAAKVAPAKKA